MTSPTEGNKTPRESLPGKVQIGSPEYRVLISLAGNNCHLRQDQLKNILGKINFEEGVTVCTRNKWIIFVKHSGDYFLEPRYKLVFIPPQNPIEINGSANKVGQQSQTSTDNIIKNLRRKSP
jgi:hypothetical protein